MRRVIGSAVGLALALAAATTWAEVYKWVDKDGTTHFSQDYNTLGGSGRHDREEIEPSRVEVLPLHDGSKKPEETTPADKVHEIAMISSGGGSYIVRVRLNDRITVPMIFDTGASDVVITEATARSLGYTDRDIVDMRSYSTANGEIHQPVVRLLSVSVGSAKVLMVPTSISDSMSTGLLGMSFLRHFEYTIRDRKLILREK